MRVGREGEDAALCPWHGELYPSGKADGRDRTHENAEGEAVPSVERRWGRSAVERRRGGSGGVRR